MSNQVIDNPTRRSVVCVTSSNHPACIEQDTNDVLLFIVMFM